jgi:hypothetical protein
MACREFKRPASTSPVVIPSTTIAEAVKEHRPIATHLGSADLTSNVGPRHDRSGGSPSTRHSKLSSDGDSEDVAAGLETIAKSDSEVSDCGTAFIPRLPDASITTWLFAAEAIAVRAANSSNVLGKVIVLCLRLVSDVITVEGTSTAAPNIIRSRPA